MSETMLCWVTRTAPDNRLTADRLVAIGHSALTVPVLQVRPVPLPSAIGRPDALAFTSAHGVRHHQFKPCWRELPVFAVGDHSATAARRAGYVNVHSADGDVRDLKHLVEMALPCPSKIIHFSALEPSGDFAASLRQSGYDAENIAVYETVPASDAELRAAFAKMSILDGIVVHSPKGARRVASIVVTTGWRGTIFCISSACAAEFEDLPGLRLRTAARPTEESLMNMLHLEREHPGLLGEHSKRVLHSDLRHPSTSARSDVANDNSAEVSNTRSRKNRNFHDRPDDTPPTVA